MSRHDPALFQLASYPHHTELFPRSADLDSFRHINNAAMAALLEEARSRFNRASGFEAQPPAFGMVIVSMTIDFLAEAGYPAPLLVGTAIGEIGRTSFVQHQLVLQDGQPVALSRATMVNVVGGTKSPLAEDRRIALQPWLLGASAEVQR